MAPLLTLHADRLDRLPISYAADGDDLAGNWLLQAAAETEVITWDSAVWGRLMFVARVVRSTSGKIHPDLIELDLLLANEGPWLHTEIEPQEALAADAFNALTTEEQEELPARFPDPTREPGGYLALVVDELNELFERTAAMVAAWPGATGTPLI